MSVPPFEELVAAVTAGLARLPGVEAQLRMAPQPRGGWKPGFAPDEARPAAALLLLFPVDTGAVVLLTKRSPDLPHHAGQVSLPGGAVDPGESIEDAALREAEEEVGSGARRCAGDRTPDAAAHSGQRVRAAPGGGRGAGPPGDAARAG